MGNKTRENIFMGNFYIIFESINMTENIFIIFHGMLVYSDNCKISSK